MGLSASKRVARILDSSPDFHAAYNSVYDDCLGLAQRAFPGVRPYQLPGAAFRLHLALSAAPLPIIKRWAPSPPTQAQVDRASRAAAGDDGAECLSRVEFRAFAVELFRDVVVSNARERVMRRVPVGVAGIAGLGALTRSGKGVVGSVMGIYALGVAAAVYLSMNN